MAAPAVVAAPGQLAVAATAAEQAAAREVRRAHPLYADVTLRLLTEILNSRLFTTARPARPACPQVREMQASRRVYMSSVMGLAAHVMCPLYIRVNDALT